MPFHRVLWHSVGFHVIPHRILRNSTMFYCILQGSMAFCAGFYGLSQDSGGFYGIPPGDIGDIRTSHCNERLRGHWGHKDILLYEHWTRDSIWVEAVRYNEMFVHLGSRGSTMRCSGVPATGHLNIRHGTPEHLIVRTVTHKPTNRNAVYIGRD